MRNEIVLSPLFQVRVDLRRYSEEYQYTADIVTVNGNVTGGGSRVKTVWIDGIRFRIQNRDTAPRRYHVVITLYKSLKRQLIARTISLGSETARPGQSVEIDVRLERGEKVHNLILDEFIVVNPDDNKRVKTHATDWNLGRVAFAQMPIWLKTIRFIFNTVALVFFGCLALLIALMLAPGVIDFIWNVL